MKWIGWMRLTGEVELPNTEVRVAFWVLRGEIILAEAIERWLAGLEEQK